MSTRQTRVPHSSETCAECASLLRLLGDRDKQIRGLQERAARTERAADDLADVVNLLDGAGVTSDTGKAHTRLTVAGRIRTLLAEGSVR